MGGGKGTDREREERWRERWGEVCVCVCVCVYRARNKAEWEEEGEEGDREVEGGGLGVWRGAGDEHKREKEGGRRRRRSSRRKEGKKERNTTAPQFLSHARGLMLTRLKPATNKNIAPREKGGAERGQRTGRQTDGQEREREGASEERE